MTILTINNRISPKVLLGSKWTKVSPVKKEKHFIVTLVKFNEQQKVVACEIEAVKTQQRYAINWRELKQRDKWLMGWQS